MKQILFGDSGVINVIGSKAIKPDVSYRWSDFAFPFSDGNDQYVFNTLTKRCYQVGKDLRTDREAVFSAAEVQNDSELTTLANDVFLVPTDKNEAAFYEEIITFMRLIKGKGRKKGYRSFVILPTTACNARCFYCFEAGMKYVTMTADTADKVAHFIIDNARPDTKISLSWFGGEPLIGEKIIDRISKALTEANIDFSAKIVTNGSLITEEIIKKMMNEWKIVSMQITLDGVEEEYNRRKNYYYKYDSAYWHVLSRIKMINDNGIALCIRINIDEDNMGGVMQMIEDLRPFIKYKKPIIFDLVPLFDVQSGLTAKTVWEELFNLMDCIEAEGYAVLPHSELKSLKLYHCMADNTFNAITISPQGKLYDCENLDAFDSIGTVEEGVTNKELICSLKALEKTPEKCKGCAFLPICTSFTRCPNSEKTDCRYSVGRYLERSLIKKLSDEKEDNTDSIDSEPEDGTDEC